MTPPAIETLARPDPYPAPAKRLIVDAVIHGYNFLPENARNAAAASFIAATYGMVAFTGHKTQIPQESYARDWDIESVAKLVFVESDVDIATYHAVPLDDYYYDGISSNAKGIEMHRRWPHRVLFYGAVNAAQHPAKVLEDAQALVEQGAVGIKLYPERYEETGVVPVELDSPACAPLFDWASRAGIVIAIHKAFPAGLGRMDNYRLGDVEGAAALFPEVRLEVVHSGMAFLDETTWLLQRYENVWANLEVTSAFAVRGRVRFGESLGRLLMSGAGDRIVFASGCPLVHPQPIIEAMEDFSMPEELRVGYGYPAISERLLDGIFGLNYLRLHGLDEAGVRVTLNEDEFALERARLGVRPEPWSLV